ncbi:MAG: hypothetical protein AB7E70_19470 [Hyphomicrobiaceae bacterium]
MEALVALAVGAPLALVAFFLTRGLVSVLPAQVERTRQADERGNKQELRAERAEFSLGVTKHALDESERERIALGKELADALESTSPGDGLASTDVRGRLRRIAERAARAKSGGAVPAVAADEVPDASATDGAGPAGLPPLEDPRLQ